MPRRSCNVFTKTTAGSARAASVENVDGVDAPGGATNGFGGAAGTAGAVTGTAPDGKGAGPEPLGAGRLQAAAPSSSPMTRSLNLTWTWLPRHSANANRTGPVRSRAPRR